MSVSILITVAAALLGSGGLGAIVAAVVNAQKNNADSENEARALFTAEFNAVVAQQNVALERMERELKDVKAEVQSIRREHAEAEMFIDRLISGISNGTIPPIPERRF
mgnify:CR=1 FL=1